MRKTTFDEDVTTEAKRRSTRAHHHVAAQAVHAGRAPGLHRHLAAVARVAGANLHRDVAAGATHR